MFNKSIQIQSISLSFVKLVGSAILLRYTVLYGGGGALDAYALAVVHTGLLTVVGLPWLAACRRELGDDADNVHILVLKYVLPALVIVVGVACSAIGLAFMLRCVNISYFNENITVYAWTLFVGGFASGSTAIEYISGKRGLQRRVRFLDVGFFVLLSCVAILWRSAILAACASSVALVLARTFTVCCAVERRSEHPRRHIRVSFSSASARVKVAAEPIRVFVHSGAWRSGLSNAVQSCSVVALYSYAEMRFEAGVVGAVAVAYRFAGPLQMIAGQISYSVWDTRDPSRGGVLLFIAFLFSLGASLVAPNFIEYYLEIDGTGINPVTSFLACLHVLAQGMCQIYSTLFYNRGAYRELLIASYPHGMIVGSLILFDSIFDVLSIELFVAVLLGCSVAEFVVIRLMQNGLGGWSQGSDQAVSVDDFEY